MRQRRYEYLTDIINIVKPETIIEIGVARGENAQRMIQAAGFNVEYTGFDVFDNTDKEWHKLVGNGKGVLNEEQIKSKLEPMCSQVSLVKGFTQETLWAQNYTADLVFIDGDHRSSMIIGDHKAVDGSKVIIFDDYYMAPNGDFSPPDFGCNIVVDDLDWKIITPPTRKLKDVRLAIWTADENIRNKLYDLLIEDAKK